MAVEHKCSDDGDDEVGPYRYGERSFEFINSAGFRYVTFRIYDVYEFKIRLGHYTFPKEMEESPTTDNSPLILLGPTSYAKFVTGEPSMKSNFCPLISPVGNRDDVAIPLESIRAISEWKLLLVDVDGKPLPNIVSTVNTDSDNEVEEVYDEHTTFMASIGLKCGSDSGYGTNSLWEQWMKTKRDDNLYDDDLYDSHDMFDNLHAICDEFDITVSDQKKK
nr:acyl-protein thioesterase 2-like [Tanacetum cinerariifolium]